jgi:hypothetical protein
VLKVYGQVSEIKVSQWRRKGLHLLRGGGGAHGSGTCFETYRISNLIVGSSGVDAILSDRGSILKDLGLTSLNITDSLRNVRPIQYARHGFAKGWVTQTVISKVYFAIPMGNKAKQGI